MDAQPGFPFRWVLPITQLLVCIVILRPDWPSLRAEVGHSLEGLKQSLLESDKPAPDSEIVIDVTPAAPPPPTEPNFYEIRITTPAALNLPVGIAQIPFVLTSPTRTEWVPSGMWLREWRAVSWPFVGAIFWWIAGRGLEALGAARQRLIRPRLHWAETATGVALFISSVVVGVVLTDRGRDTPPADLVLTAGGVLWAILGAVIVAARLMQWRVRYKARVEKLVEPV